MRPPRPQANVDPGPIGGARGHVALVRVGAIVGIVALLIQPIAMAIVILPLFAGGLGGRMLFMLLFLPGASGVALGVALALISGWQLTAAPNPWHIDLRRPGSRARMLVVGASLIFGLGLAVEPVGKLGATAACVLFIGALHQLQGHLMDLWRPGPAWPLRGLLLVLVGSPFPPIALLLLSEPLLGEAPRLLPEALLIASILSPLAFVVLLAGLARHRAIAPGTDPPGLVDGAESAGMRVDIIDRRPDGTLLVGEARGRALRLFVETARHPPALELRVALPEAPGGLRVVQRHPGGTSIATGDPLLDRLLSIQGAEPALFTNLHEALLPVVHARPGSAIESQEITLRERLRAPEKLGHQVQIPSLAESVRSAITDALELATTLSSRLASQATRPEIRRSEALDANCHASAPVPAGDPPRPG